MYGKGIAICSVWVESSLPNSKLNLIDVRGDIIATLSPRPCGNKTRFEAESIMFGKRVSVFPSGSCFRFSRIALELLDRYDEIKTPLCTITVESMASNCVSIFKASTGLACVVCRSLPQIPPFDFVFNVWPVKQYSEALERDEHDRTLCHGILPRFLLQASRD